MLFNKKSFDRKNFLLVTGTGRSGTTMLRTALGNHSNIYYRGNENNIFLDLLNTFYFNSTFPSRKVAMEMPIESYNSLVKDTLFRLLFPNPNEINSKHKYIQCYSALDATIIPYIKTLFPNIKIIQIVRNGIAVVSSRMNYEGFRKNEFIDHIQKWNRGVEVSLECKDIIGENFKLLKHEDFLNKDSLYNQVSSICKWLNIENPETIVNTIINTQFHPTKLKDEKEDSTINNRSNRWKFWTEEQKELFKDLASENMKLLDYEVPF